MALANASSPLHPPALSVLNRLYCTASARTNSGGGSRATSAGLLESKSQMIERRLTCLRGATLTICLLLLTVSSCARGLDVELFNNTGTNLTVTCYDTVGTSRSETLPTLARVRITGSEFIVQGELAEWRYTLIGHSPPDHFIDRTHFNKLVHLQIERNGDIYILPPDTLNRPSSLPLQPAGYPIHPQIQGAS